MRMLSMVRSVGARERPWVLLISASIFFLMVGVVLYDNVILTVVIKRAGVQYVPVMSAVGAFATLAGAWLGLGPLRRMTAAAQAGLFAAITAAGAVALGFLYPAVGGSTLPVLAFGALGATVSALGVGGALTRLNNTQIDVFDVAALQRIDPIMTSSAVAGILCGGAALGALSARVSTGALLVLAGALMVVALPLIAALGARWKRAHGSGVIALEPEEHPVSFRPSRIFRRKDVARFVWILGLIVGLSYVFGRLFGFSLSVLADAHFAAEGDMNAFFGWLTVAGGILEIVFLNVAQARVMGKLGLLRSLLLPPVAVLGMAALVAAVPSFWMAVVAVTARQIVINLQGTSFQAMTEGLSDYDRARAWSWIEGGAEFASDLFSSGLVFVVSLLVLPFGVGWTVRTMALLAVAFLAVRFFLDRRMWTVYPELLRASVLEGDFKTRLRALESMAEFRFLKDRDLAPLMRVASDPAEPPSLRTAAIDALAAIRDASTLGVLSEALGDPRDDVRLAALRAVAAFDFAPEDVFRTGFSRHDLTEALRRRFLEERRPEAITAVLQALVAVRDEKLVEFLIEGLSSPVAEIRHSALRAVRRFKDPRMIDRVRPLLDDPVDHVRGQAMAALWQFPSERAALEGRLARMLEGSVVDRKIAAYVVGSLRLAARRSRLEGLLAEPAAALEAAIALLKLGDFSGEATLRAVLANGAPDDAIRVAALVNHPELSEKAQLFVEGLVHASHLHYPQDLPVSEPLRARLSDIPRACLERLRSEYASAEGERERRKIESALADGGADRPMPHGRVRLVGVSEPWRRMGAIALLAAGWIVLTAGEDGRAIIVSEQGAPEADGADVLIGDAPGAVRRGHAAPSDLVRAVGNAARHGGSGVLPS